MSYNHFMDGTWAHAIMRCTTRLAAKVLFNECKRAHEGHGGNRYSRPNGKVVCTYPEWLERKLNERWER